MSYVWACYIAVFGVLIVYATRLVLKSRDVAAKVLARDAVASQVPEDQR